MRHFIWKRLLPLTTVLICALAMAACQTDRSANPATGTVAETPTIRPLENSPTATPADDITFGPGPFTLSDPAVGLSNLASYRATLTVDFDGTRNGQPEQWSRTYTLFAAQKPAARQVTIKQTGQQADQPPVDEFIAEVDGTQYVRHQGGVCTSSSIHKSSSVTAPWEPAGFLSPVIGAEEAGSAAVNGIATNHYTFDERATVTFNITNTVGEVWVATNGGYVVKYTTTTQAGPDYFGAGVAGTLTQNYALTDVNGSGAATLPEDCSAGLVDISLMPDAADVHRYPGVTSYTTAASLADALAFYQKQLTDWTTTDKPFVTDALSRQIFTQDKQQLTVIATSKNGRTTVWLIAGDVVSLDPSKLPAP